MSSQIGRGSGRLAASRPPVGRGDLHDGSHGGPAYPDLWDVRAGARGPENLDVMPTGLTAERVRQDVDVVARAGLDIESFLEEAVESVRRAVPWVGACLATDDPGTQLLTGARKYGDLRRERAGPQLRLIEYGTAEPTSFTELPAPGSGPRGCTARR